MTLSIPILLGLATLSSSHPDDKTHPDDKPQPNEPNDELAHLTDRRVEKILAMVKNFRSEPPTPASGFRFERELDAAVRALARDLTEYAYNDCESDDPSKVASHTTVEGEKFFRTPKTSRRIHTLFGPIALRRYRYRPLTKDLGLPSQFPLERSLGLILNTTPSLAEAASRYSAGAGATQQFVIGELKNRHSVSLGAGQLRKIASHAAAAMAEVREDSQVDYVLKLLTQAFESKGRTRPMISVGRDGITVREHRNRLFEVASVATVTVKDRSGKGLGTVYLGFAPEHLQITMTQQLGGLIQAILRRWEGPMPRLAYVTDAGDNESGFYEKVLKPMKHPVTGKPVEWERVVDFYHTMQRIWTMAWILFGADSADGRKWAHRMRRLLKQPNGRSRVLHSAATLKLLRGLAPSREDDFELAYNYIRSRMKWMQYDRCARLRIPIGSGITEAACRTVFTQRLKLSGMRWSGAGAQVILDLRVVLLSRVWNEVFERIIEIKTNGSVRTQRQNGKISVGIAA